MSEKVRQFLDWLLKKEHLIIGGFIFITMVVYLIMHGNIRKENIDDPWVLAWVYNFSKNGIERDICFMLGRPGSGVSLFFKLFAVIYGLFLNTFGWTLSNAYWLSTFFIWSSLGLWYLIFKELKFSKQNTVIAVFSCLLLEPYLYVANLARADALGFLLTTFAFFLFLKKKYLFSGICCVLAFETHPMGIMSLVYIGSYVLAEYNTFLSDIKGLVKDVIIYFIGIAIGISIYMMWHGHNLGDFLFFVGPMRGTIKNNFIWAYFFNEKYMRHLPELFVVVVALGVYIKTKIYKQHIILNLLMVFTVISSLVINRDISLYIIYLYPIFAMMIVVAFNQIKMRSFVPIGLVILLIPQYILAYKMYSGYDVEAYITKLRGEIEVENQDTCVVGNANSWFAFKDMHWHEYSSINYGNFDHYKKIYFVENKTYINYTIGRQEQWGKIIERSPSTIIDSFEINGESVNIRIYEAK